MATNSTYAEAAGDIEVNGQKAQVMDRTAAMSKYGLEACTNRVAAGVTNCYWIAGELVQLTKK